MNRSSIKSNCRTAAAAFLVLALLARVPFAQGLLLHDHGDDGFHSHAVTLDDLHEGDLRAAWHRHHENTHENNREDRNNDSDGGEYAASLFIFVNDPSTALGILCSSSTMIASLRHLSSGVLPQSILPSSPSDASRRPLAHRRRPACALDALLQTSHALLL